MNRTDFKEYWPIAGMCVCIFFYVWSIIACVMDERVALLIVDLTFFPVGIVHGFIDFISVVFG